MASFVIGCPCNNKIEVSSEQQGEVRCPKCKRYLKIPNLKELPVDLKTKTLLAASQDDNVGKILAKRFRLDSYISDGASGRIYRATDLLLKRSVAIKILKSLSLSPELKERYEKRFLTEAKIGTELNHPGIVTIRSLHKTNKGTIFIVMDYCTGRSLRNILAEKKTLPLKETIEICCQILSALEVAHAKGVVHRDIKPGNIMIEKESSQIRVKILDFGIAKVVSEIGGLDQQSLTRTGYIIGTTRYMAPEQISNQNIGPHTDIYAVACLFYHMIGGVTPFMGTKQQVLRAILREQPPSLRRYCKDKPYLEPVPLIVDTILEKALAKKPEHRFASAAEFREALENYQHLSLSQLPLFWQSLLQRWLAQISVTKKMLAATTIMLLAMVTIYFGWVQPYLHNQGRVYQLRNLLKQHKYSAGLALIGQIPLNKRSLEEVKLGKKLLMAGYKQEYQAQNWDKAKEYLEKLEWFYDPEVASYLAMMFREEIHLYKIEQLLQQKKYQQAQKLLKDRTNPLVEFYRTREERKAWLEKVQSK